MWRCWRGTRRCAHRDGPPLARVRADEAGGDRGEDQHGLQSLAEHDQRGVGDDRCAAGRARHLGRVGRPGAGRRHEVDGASDECQKRRPEQAAGEAWSGAAGGRGCRRHGALTVWNTNLRHRISPAWSHGVLIGAAHLGRGRWRWSPPQEAISVAIATGLFVAGSHWVGPAANAPLPRGLLAGVRPGCRRRPCSDAVSMGLGAPCGVRGRDAICVAAFRGSHGDPIGAVDARRVHFPNRRTRTT